ncbi:MurR/RpiR family transcriptional regulator [Pradoshia sp. D12]|uniref:MurR/RpiR family transcriptional regulator n=1 Tax=Bacillaceae TaxID=186817 RepID=UPI001125F20F|nr:MULTISPECIES: MurR/RpiR family transcriptional regulator [Bacillaceae]QFK71377.1 MurR/RpiR family transcriptional regulator [Pradoshia sp. D12]TPF73172.1 MurR/RpiR family transcriptional regulator [Bacillus sp. D12]
MVSGVLKMVVNRVEQLPASERKIAEYILENPYEVVNCKVNELAEKTSSSGAAVIRLCKSLGLNGFQDLKVRIAGDLGRPEEPGYRDIERDETAEMIVQKTLNNSIQSLRDSSEVINYEELKKAVDVLLKAKNVHFFGIGASSIIAVDAQQKLLRINKSATAFSDAHLVATLIANAEPDDVVFTISFSGETIEVIEVTRLAKEQGVQTISLTKYGPSSVAALADINLYTSYSKEAPFRSAATSSRLAQLFMIDILFLSMATEQYEETVRAIDKTREAIRFMKGKTYK